MGVKVNTSKLVARVQAMQKGADSSAVTQALTRIGLLVMSLARFNVRRQGLIDTGRLLNSLRYEFIKGTGTKQGIQVGSFNVPYAAVHEFGFNGNVMVKQHQRTITKSFGRPIEPMSVTVRAHTMKQKVKKRPYLNPAIRKATPFIVDQLRIALGFKK